MVFCERDACDILGPRETLGPVRLLILLRPSSLFLSLLRQRKKQRKATLQQIAPRAEGVALRCLRKACITCMALVLTLPENAAKQGQAYKLIAFFRHHQS